MCDAQPYEAAYLICCITTMKERRPGVGSLMGTPFQKNPNHLYENIMAGYDKKQRFILIHRQ